MLLVKCKSIDKVERQVNEKLAILPNSRVVNFVYIPGVMMGINSLILIEYEEWTTLLFFLFNWFLFLQFRTEIGSLRKNSLRVMFFKEQSPNKLHLFVYSSLNTKQTLTDIKKII